MLTNLVLFRKVSNWVRAWWSLTCKANRLRRRQSCYFCCSCVLTWHWHWTGSKAKSKLIFVLKIVEVWKCDYLFFVDLISTPAIKDCRCTELSKAALKGSSGSAKLQYLYWIWMIKNNFSWVFHKRVFPDIGKTRFSQKHFSEFIFSKKLGVRLGWF